MNISQKRYLQNFQNSDNKCSWPDAITDMAGNLPYGTFCQEGIYHFCDNWSCPMYAINYEWWYEYGSGYYIGCNPMEPDYSGE